MQDCVPYIPMINGRHQKTVMDGDQGFFERGFYNWVKIKIMVGEDV
jgi:hypothetical protein